MHNRATRGHAATRSRAHTHPHAPSPPPLPDPLVRPPPRIPIPHLPAPHRPSARFAEGDRELHGCVVLWVGSWGERGGGAQVWPGIRNEGRAEQSRAGLNRVLEPRNPALRIHQLTEGPDGPTAPVPGNPSSPGSKTPRGIPGTRTLSATRHRGGAAGDPFLPASCPRRTFSFSCFNFACEPNEEIRRCHMRCADSWPQRMLTEG